MNNLLTKFNPFSSREEVDLFPELMITREPFPKQQNHMTLSEEPNNPDSAIVVYRGHKQDCEMMKEHLNDLMQKHLYNFLIENKEEIFAMIAQLNQEELEKQLNDLGFEEPTAEDIARGKFGVGINE